MSNTNNIRSDQDIKNTNKILQSQGDANTYYNDIKDDLVYKEIKPDGSKIPDLVDIGCICNDEFSSFTFNTNRYWDADTIMPNLKNAEKMLNDLAWTEQSSLHNGAIRSSPGMVVLTKNANAYIQDDTAYFNDVLASASGPSPTFNTFGGTGGSSSNTAIDLFGYFHPDVTGTWKFGIPASSVNTNVFSYLWVGDSALFDYTADNADINSTTAKTGNQNYKAFDLVQDDYVPFRVQFISKNAAFNGIGSVFTITSPANSVMAGGEVTTNPTSGPGKDWTFFATFTKNGAVYYKNILYFGVVLSDTDPQRANCYFIDANDESHSGANAQNIRKYKTYPKLQYVKVNVPTPAMSGKGQVVAYDGDPVKLTQIPGVNITINKAYYGLPNNFSYNYITYYDEPVDIPIDTTVESKIITTPDSNLPTKPITTTTNAYVKSVTKRRQKITPMEAKQQIDVTAKLQSMVEQGYKLEINAGQNNFLNLFGDPIEETITPDIRNPNKNNPNVRKMLVINFTITVEDRLITEKTLQVDSNSAKITVSATFNGYNISAPMPMTITPPCGGNNCGKGYKMRLSDDAKLQVVNTNGAVVGNIDLVSSATENAIKRRTNFDINACKVNTGLQNDPTPISTELDADVPISRTNGNKIKSPNNKFKLAFENGKLTFTYCILPYVKGYISATQQFGFTTFFNVSNMNNSQIFYLYRINTRGLVGRRFLNETNIKTGSTILHYIPNTHNYVLTSTKDAAKFEQPFSGIKVYPLMKDNELAFPDRYSKTVNANSYMDCANQCLASDSCEHFFFLTNNGAPRCYTDVVADSNPTYTTTTSNPSITSSSYYKKPYTVTTSCQRSKDGLQLKSYLEKEMPKNAAIDYSIPENRPNLSYYCSLPRYKQDNAEVLKTYNANVPAEGIKSVAKESFATLREGLDSPAATPSLAPAPKIDTTQFGPYAPDILTSVISKFPALNAVAQHYSQMQDKIGEQYDQTIDKLRKYDNVNSVVSSPQYKENTTDTVIPEKFINIPGPKPQTSLIDGTKKDVGIMLMQQNTMYTVMSITAATCLILGVAFGGAGGGNP